MAESWKDYQVSDWNSAFLRSFFRVEDSCGDSQESLTRLVISARDLARAVGANEADKSAVKDAFVSAMRLALCSHGMSLFKHAVRISEAASWHEASENEPPFVAHLILSCLAVTEFEDDLFDHRAVQPRIDELAGDHCKTHNPHPLPGLWEDLASWLERQHDNGCVYRRISLPDRGHLTRIGYTVNLAFPRQRDLEKLITIIRDRDLAGIEPPVHLAIEMVTKKKKLFSKWFLHLFEEFTEWYRRDEPGISGHPFWRAIRYASDLAVDHGDRAAQKNIWLFGDLDEDNGQLRFFLVARNPDVIGKTAGLDTTERVDFPDRYEHIVVADPRISENESEEAIALIAGKRTRSAELSKALHQGVLIFNEVALGVFQLAREYIAGETKLAIVRSDLVSAFRDAHVVPSSLLTCPSVVDGWTQFERLENSEIDSDALTAPPLSEVWCLRRVTTKERIHVAGGIRTLDGYLGFKEWLPRIRVANADYVLLSSCDSHESIRLKRVARDLFEIPVSGDVDGKRRLQAFTYDETEDDQDADDGKLFARRQIEFCSPHTSTYKSPSYDDRFRVEGTGLEMEPIKESGLVGIERISLSGKLETNYDEYLSQADWSDLFSNQPKINRVPNMKMQVIPVSGRAANKKGLDPARVGRLESALLAMFANRTAIREREFLDLLHVFLLPDSDREGQLLWDLARSWVESGVVECVADVRSKGRVYVMCPPRFVKLCVGGKLAAAIVGLLPPDYRKRCEDALCKKGLSWLERDSVHPLSPRVPLLGAEDIDALDNALVDLKERLPRSLVHPESLMREFSLIGRTQKPPPAGYRAWTPHPCGKAATASGQRIAVHVQRFTHVHMPDWYALLLDNDVKAWSYSRNAAYLMGELLVDPSTFEPGQSAWIRRKAGRRGYLPLPLARMTAHLARFTPGPNPEVPGEYLYPSPNRVFRHSVREQIERARNELARENALKEQRVVADDAKGVTEATGHA